MSRLGRSKATAADEVSEPFQADSTTQRGVQQCRKRDQKKCILTNDKSPEVAHIYPYSLLNENEKKESSFWAVLRSFWTDEHVNEWYGTIFGQDGEKGLDGCYNMLCLAANMHSHWNDGVFALKPLPAAHTDEDEMQEKSMRIQFFWQPRYQHQRVSLSNKPLSSAGLMATGGVTAGWHTFNDRGDQITAQGTIRSGDMFRLTTPNPKTYPLPSRALLDMQWVLQRILAMRGAADHDEYDDDAEDGCPYDAHVILTWMETSSFAEEASTKSLSSLHSPEHLLLESGPVF